MHFLPVSRVSCAVFLLVCGLAAVCQQYSGEHNSGGPSYSVQNAPLTAQQVAKKLQERNAERAPALGQVSSKRIYKLQYRGFPSDRDADMVVNVTYHSPDTKEFSVISQTGSKFIIDHIFKKLLESEQEFANEENRQHTALTTANYDFSMAGYESTPQGPQYVLNLFPKTTNKFLYRGKIWVDAKDFAVVRIEGEPARNPSWWIKKTEIDHKYTKVNGFWLPAENHTESLMRFGGRATLTIEYKDYKIAKAAPLQGQESAGALSK